MSNADTYFLSDSDVTDLNGLSKGLSGASEHRRRAAVGWPAASPDPQNCGRAEI